MFSEKIIPNSQFTSSKSESNIIFDNNLNNNYLRFVTSYTISFTLFVTPFSLKVQLRH